jgi:hypothetical protein
MSIEIDSRVGPDGVLELRVPLGQAAANTEVHIKIDSAKTRFATQEEWKAFVQRVAGSVTDETFVRQPQGEYEQRESLD